MTNKDIEKKLIEILRIRIGVNIDEEQKDEHLFSKKVNMAPRNLVYLYFFIQEEFDIEIDNKYILDGSFSTIKSIVDIIYETLKAKEKTVVG